MIVDNVQTGSRTYVVALDTRRLLRGLTTLLVHVDEGRNIVRVACSDAEIKRRLRILGAVIIEPVVD